MLDVNRSWNPAANSAAGRLPVKMPAHKLSPSSKVRWQHCTGTGGGHYNVITAGINSDEVNTEAKLSDITRHFVQGLVLDGLICRPLQIWTESFMASWSVSK